MQEIAIYFYHRVKPIFSLIQSMLDKQFGLDANKFKIAHNIKEKTLNLVRNSNN